MPSQIRIWLNTTLMLLSLFAISWWVGSGFDFDIFALPALGTREIFAAFVALGLVFVLRACVRAIRSDEERRKLAIYKLAPRGTREWLLWSAMILCAGIIEEAVYRGVALQVLWHTLGNPWIAAAISSLAFAAAHWVQGFKSGVMIFGIALLMHGLVAYTHTLVLAMFVHVIYDFSAGWLIHRQANADLNQAASTSPRAQ